MLGSQHVLNSSGYRSRHGWQYLRGSHTFPENHETGPNTTKAYIDGRPEKGDGWKILKRAADTVKDAGCVILYVGKFKLTFL